MAGGDGFEIFAAQGPAVGDDEQDQRADAGDQQQQIGRQQSHVDQGDADRRPPAHGEFDAQAQRVALGVGVVAGFDGDDDLVLPHGHHGGGDAGKAEPGEQHGKQEGRGIAGAVGPEALQPLWPAIGFDHGDALEHRPAEAGEQQQREQQRAQQDAADGRVPQLREAEDEGGGHFAL